MEHSPEFLQMVAEIMPLVKEVTVGQAVEKSAKGTTMIDVREDNEYAAGHAAGAEHIGRGVIERDIVAKHPDKAEELILYCGGGYRSALVAANLKKMGYSNVWSMAGGWTAWNEANGPVDQQFL